MFDLAAAFSSAIALIAGLDAELFAIVRLSLGVSLAAVAIAAVIGLPLGAFLALARFPGREVVLVALNALMGLPPVVVGLAVYVLLSRAGPLGSFGLLFTPGAMVVAQAVLVTPIIAALGRQAVADLWEEYGEQLRSLGAPRRRVIGTLLWDGRHSLITVLLAGFGRAAAEVGAVMIVGGNIKGLTRTMTTAISLETSKGDLAMALGLGMILLAVVAAVNGAAFAAGAWARRVSG
ncbi:MAG: ABC transporter permease [Alphaproteobacteria bacterium]|nr:ABC transporter permease [Alphaproteobacteria bacterium]